jgi:hypothetical protein
MGKAYLLSGAYFEGEFVNGTACGKGCYIYPNGSYYVGDLVDSAACGRGTYLDANGYKYEG